MQHPLIFDIQRFSLHDGPGIRTTVFFKGCPLRCQWCHNPESQRFTAECMDREGRASKAVGMTLPLPDLFEELKKDQMFYDQSGGGVTFSGGEALAQEMEYVETLAQMLARKGFSLAVDTCGDVPYDHFRRVLPYTDWFLYDLKLLDAESHRRYTGVSNERILTNLRRLSRDDARINLRLILLEGVNAEPAHMEEMIRWIRQHEVLIKRINLLPYHAYGRGKYLCLGRKEPPAFAPPDNAKLEKLRRIWTDAGYKAAIGGGWDE